jgi:hypothetical protein
MAHEYSVLVHEYLSKKLTAAEDLKKQAVEQTDREMQEYYEGQIAELRYIRSYLSENVDLATQNYY